MFPTVPTPPAGYPPCALQLTSPRSLTFFRYLFSNMVGSTSRVEGSGREMDGSAERVHYNLVQERPQPWDQANKINNRFINQGLTTIFRFPRKM